MMHCLSTVAVKYSVESSVESLISRYETHFDRKRQLTEENAHQEMVIAEVGSQKKNTGLFWEPLIQKLNLIFYFAERTCASPRYSPSYKGSGQIFPQ